MHFSQFRKVNLFWKYSMFILQKLSHYSLALCTSQVINHFILAIIFILLTIEFILMIVSFQTQPYLRWCSVGSLHWFWGLGHCYMKRLRKIRFYTLEFCRINGASVEIHEALKGTDRKDAQRFWPYSRNYRDRGYILKLLCKPPWTDTDLKISRD